MLIRDICWTRSCNIKFRTAYGQANKNIDKMNYTAITHPLNNYILVVLSLSVLVQGLGRTEGLN